LENRTREINADTERLHQRLRDIAQAVINDEDYQFDGGDSGQTSPRRLSPTRGGDRFDSPDRGYTRYVISHLSSLQVVRKQKYILFKR
jgi:hypothetical protein